MINVKDFMTPIQEYLQPNQTLHDAIFLMNKYRLNTLPVVDASEKLIGVFTRSVLYQQLLSNEKMQTSIGKFIRKDIGTISEDTSVEELEEQIAVSEVGTGFVVDKTGKPIGVIDKADAIKSFLQKTQLLTEQLKWKSLLQTVIDNSYDGLVMVNEKGNITFVSPSLIELFDLNPHEIEDVPIDSIFPHFELTTVFKTGIAEISDFMEIKGINYIVHRIPVYQEDQIIGAIGKIVYRQLQEVRERFRSYEKLEKQNDVATKKAETSRFTFDEILSHNSQMEKLFRSGMKAAKGKTTIMIRGESGTGKELFAHAIHSASNRKNGPFITVNCAAIPEHLLESEFFGYDEGAFTGAKQKGKAGKFEMADGGTLFLDEVGDMSLQLQAKLLRVLQEREFYRVGGTNRISVDVRIITATHQKLEEMVEGGKFREDLFYRLNVISIEIPPLRKRKEDILQLSHAFISELNKQNGTSIIGWDPVVEQALMEYDWPGNVRELRNVFERAMVFAENGMITLEDLPDYLLKKIGMSIFLEEENENCDKTLLEKAEEMAIKVALKKSDGNKSKACKLLGISRSVLYDKLKKYDDIKIP
ncbi:transcriptional regulator with PAS, ATPase and Fis domain [Neobacillus niacini]|uniref:sigma 54-interacting transcriptional regulator n=1 Tax=Neobacillus niacini TaxID=86668 RepID=UPI002783DD93|nr:sigma 54-interacting transcriptional regulator [Neobacillus niacini]MDQ1001790.1 transcriptional regulator with PAS, ATPase and Fis domain [Neobacillus niacini]